MWGFIYWWIQCCSLCAAMFVGWQNHDSWDWTGMEKRLTRFIGNAAHSPPLSSSSSRSFYNRANVLKWSLTFCAVAQNVVFVALSHHLIENRPECRLWFDKRLLSFPNHFVIFENDSLSIHRKRTIQEKKETTLFAKKEMIKWKQRKKNRKDLLNVSTSNSIIS